MSKTWFITGTSSGFGRQLTQKLLERGDRVAATLRKAGALDDLKATHGDRLWVGRVDGIDRVEGRGAEDGQVPILDDLHRKQKVVRGERHAVVPRGARTNLPGGEHRPRRRGRLTRCLHRK